MKWRVGMFAIWLICLFASLISLVFMLAAIVAKSSRAWRIAIGFDQLGNVTTGGDEDLTISARCWANRDRQPFKWLRVAVDWAAAQVGDIDHCKGAWESERQKIIEKNASFAHD